MKRIFSVCGRILLCGILCFGFIDHIYAQSCSSCAGVTSFTVNISANPDTTWTTSSNRNGQCCQGSGSDKCVVFYVTVSPRASEIKFTYRNGNANNGSYEINCDPLTNTSPGNSQCLGGLTSFCITYCNPGNASDAYTISTSSGFSAGSDLTLRNGCSGNLTISGLLESSLTWTSVYPGAVGTYNSYLSCLTGCDTTVVTPGAGAPPYIDYKVCGSRTGCTTGAYCDTQRVYTVAPLLVTYTPLAPVICAGAPNVTITANASGGSSPYTYLWSNGSTTQTVSVPAGTYTVAVTDATTGCGAIRDTVVVSSQPAATVNAGADASICSGSNYILSGSIGGSALAATWSTSGTGTFSNNASLTPTYFPSAADITSGSVILTLTTSGPCSAANDAMVLSINAGAIASAGADTSICAGSTYTLNGTIGGGATSASWTTSGSGSFNNASLLSATYTPSAADILSGIVTLVINTNDPAGPCSPASDTMFLTITSSPTSMAGSDQTVCANNAAVNLNGSVTVATGGMWSTSGTGTFSPSNTSLIAIYTPSASDITSTTVTLTLTTTGNGACAAASDALLVTITPSPTVNAGIDQVVCANNSNVSLNGTIGIASGGNWTTSGSGTFLPNSTTLNATYIPSAADKTSGSVTITLSTTGNGNCNAVSDAMTVTITSPPTADAGIDQTVCGNNANVVLNGVVTIAAGGQWTTSGSGTFSPNGSTLSATYIPGASDIIAGSVNLMVTTTGNGGCTAVSDTMHVTITPAPTASAGADQFICLGGSTTLNGAITVATGGVWTGGGGIFTPDNNTLNAMYTPSAGEQSAGSVTLTLTTSGNGTCNGVADAMLLTITDTITVNAGVDRIVCSNNANISLTGSVSGGTTTGLWSSSGSGSFSPSNTTLNGVYIPSAADKTAGSVVLTLISTGNGGCTAVSDWMTVTITPAPIVNAGTDQTVCANNAVINLNGNITVASGGIWTTSGSGTFTNDTSLATSYIPSAIDKSVGTVTLTLTSTGNGNCLPVSDQMVVVITPAPVVNAGTDKSACINNPNVVLNGNVFIASGAQWSTLGSGTFSPNNTTLNATYLSSTNDTAAGSVKLVLTSTGNGNCLAVSDTMTINYSPPPVASAGPDQTVCANNATILLNGSSSTTSGTWSSNGTGTFSPNNSTLTATYVASAADTTNGNVMLTLTTTNNAGCNAVSDQMNITITDAPISNAGSDKSVCANNALVTLNGSFTAPASGGIWSTSGNGNFSPDNISMNATYTPGIADTANGSVTLYLVTTGNGLCNSVSDSMTIVYTNAPVVAAGNDVNVCLGSPAYLLNGNSSTGSGSWTTLGTGTFSPDNSQLNATYIPGTSDTAAGWVTLILTSTNNVGCNSASDTMTIVYTDIPVVNAGAGQTVCANNAAVSLNGFSSTGFGSWSTNGDGIFTPDAFSINATYIAGNTDTTNGAVMLTLTSVNGCIPVSSNTTIIITDAPEVVAGSDQFLCKNNPDIQLNGIVSGGASGGIWTSSGTGTFSPNDSDLNAMYIPDSTDLAAGSVLLVLHSTGNGDCQAVADSMLATFTPLPVIDAGADIYICNGSMTASLNGTMSGSSSGGHWTTSGTGTFSPDANTLNASYLLSAADTAAGGVTLMLTSLNNGNCFNVSDSLQIHITAPPVTFAGSDVSVCANNAALQLNGSVVSSTGTGVWTSTGSGIFIPGDTALDAVYQPSSSDITTGSVQLTLAATNACLTSPDTVMLTITPAPLVNAGQDDFICSGTMTVNLNGSITGGASQGKWTTTGSGFFVPNDSTLNATYHLSTADSSAGNFNLVLYSSNNGNCFAEYDSMTVTITSVPTTTVGNDTSVCENTSDVSIIGLVNGGSGTGQWITNGTGTFSPADTSLIAVYHPSAADYSSGAVTLVLAATYSCLVTTDTMLLLFIPAPFADAGTDHTICFGDSVMLNGYINHSTGGIWTTTGTGNFYPDDTATNASYIPSASDFIMGNISFTLTAAGNGNCSSASDVTDAILLSPVSADAGSDTSICAGMNMFQLNGIISGSGVSGWTTTGSGVFNPDASTLNAVYEPSAADTIAGSVNLMLSVSNTCFSSHDTLNLSLINSPTANAGADQIICAGDSAPVNGVVYNAIGLQWITSGDGIFLPDDTSLSATYYPGQSDISVGTISLALISFGECGSSIDHLTLSIVSAGTTSAGNDTSICASGSLQLNGTTAGGSTIQWTSSGTGTFIPDDAALNAVYLPSGGDTIAGNVDLILLSVNACFITRDTMSVNFFSTPAAYAGPDQNICAGDSAALNGSVVGSSALHWVTLGSGSFIPNDTVASAVYVPSPADIGVGSVVIILSTDITGTCGVTIDSLIIGITTAVSINAGSDTAVCSSANIQLNASANPGTSIQWSSTGTGTFIPDDFKLNAIYQPGAADTVAGSVTLILHGSNTCFSAQDTMVIDFFSTPSADAGPDQSICEGDSVVLNGNTSGQSGFQWTSSGTGMFFPNDSSISTTYIPSQADVASGTVIVSLNSAVTSCGYATDSMFISISPSLILNAGNDTSVCAGGQVQLNGSANTTSFIWTTSGNGAFSPNDSALNAVYHPSLLDSDGVILILSASNYCFGTSDTVHVSFAGTAVVTAGIDISICAGDSVALNGSASSTDVIQWSTMGAGSFIPDDSSLNAVYIPGNDETTSGTATLILSGMNACMTASDTLLVNIGSMPAALAGNDQTACEGVSISLSGAIVNGSGAQWSTSGDGTFTPNDSTLNALYNPGTSDNSTGSVILILTPAAGSCGAVPDTMLVNIDANPSAAFTHTPSCVNGVTDFTDASTGNNISWSWDFSGDTSSTQHPSSSFTTTGNHTVTLIVTTDAGCSDTLLKNVYVNPAPEALFTALTACPDSAAFTDASSVSSGTIVSWSWNFGDVSSGTQQNPIHIYSSPGQFIVELTVITDSGCSSTFSDSVSVNTCDDGVIYHAPVLPTAFTPNGDGHNDVLYVRGGPFNELDFRIYNEWGNEIFHGVTQAEGWDGTFHGQQQPGGKYIWTVKGNTIQNEPLKIVGQVMLIR